MNMGDSQIDRLYRRLDQIGMKEVELANAIGEAQQTVNNWKRRGTIPGAQRYKVAHAIGVTVEWLETGRGTDTVAEPAARYAGLRLIDTDTISDPRLRDQAERLITALARGDVTADKFEAALKLLLD